MPELSKLTDRLIGQPMFNLMARANELERQGKDIIHFEIGDPNFDSPHKAIISATKALQDGYTHYTNSMGLLELRKIVIKTMEKDYHFRPDLDQVLIAPANAIIDFVIRCVAEKNDEVIIPDPGFPTYYASAFYNGIRYINVPLKEEYKFSIKAFDIAKAITPRTRLIIINSPNNPTGAVIPEDEIFEIARIAKKYNLFLLSDEVYSKIIYGGKHVSPSYLDWCRERTIVLQSLSKAYAMSGWRIGYAVGPSNLITKMGLLLQTIISCLPAFTQYGAITALKECDDLIEIRRKTLEIRRDVLVDGLNSISGIFCLKPEGAFYVFPNIKQTGLSSKEFADKMLEHGVCILPGDCFGKNGEGYVRLSYASISESDIKEALNRIKGALL